MTIQADGLPDDRITCGECAHLQGFKCRKYEMRVIVPLKLRCIGFDPNKRQADKRTGLERWPTMKQDQAEMRKLDREAAQR